MWSRFVAVGDSYTEGMSDPYPGDRRYRGWADRLAVHLASHAPDLQYANLAVRGRMTQRIIDEQLPVALEMKPDLVSFACGVNDLMRPSFEIDQWRPTYEAAVRRLRESGADVLITAFGDPTGRPGFPSKWIPRYRDLNRATVEIAHEYDCRLVDFWPRKPLDRDIYWSDDRLHLSSLGHQVTAELAALALGVPYDVDSHVLAPDVRPSLARRRAEDARWLTTHAVPWLLRHARGQSSGDGIEPKRPVLAPVITGNRMQDL
jgi:lysophospholipase L1-like esterase